MAISTSDSDGTPRLQWLGWRLSPFLSPLDGTPSFFSSCKALYDLQLRCLCKDSEGFWIRSALAEVSVSKLREADEEICKCLSWLRTSTTVNFKVHYSGSQHGDYCISLPGSELESRKRHGENLDRDDDVDADNDNDDGHDQSYFVVHRSPVQMVDGISLFDALEVTSRSAIMPPKLAQSVISFYQDDARASSEMKTLGKRIITDLGLTDWTFTGTEPNTGSEWVRLQFQRSEAPRPLFVWHLNASFDLAGGDGSVTASVGYLNSEMEFVLLKRHLSEYFVRRNFKSRSFKVWATEDVDAHLASLHKKDWFSWSGESPAREGPAHVIRPPEQYTSDGWMLHCSSMLKTDYSEKYILDAPNIQAAYRDCKELGKEQRAR